MLEDGSQINPWQITTHFHLKASTDFVNAGNSDSTINKYYMLMNDIDLSGYANWKPIGMVGKRFYLLRQF